MRRIFLTACVLAVVTFSAAQPPPAGAAAGSLKFAVLGDSGSGDRGQYELAEQMRAARAAFPFEFVIMLGDNIYGRPDLVAKFERPYKPLIDAGVRFYAALGNHDDEDQQRAYPLFNMSGERYYTFARQHVRFIVLDTNFLDPKQLAWADRTLASVSEPWKIVYFHHPIYSNGGRHGSNVQLRVVLEPMFVKYGVDVVFASHDHVYERLKPQKGITYFVQGAGGRLRKGDLRASPLTAVGYDADQSFMLVDVDGDRMFFRAISRTGTTVDSGAIERAQGS